MVPDATLSWRFPMAFVDRFWRREAGVRQRIDLSDTGEFGARKLNIPLDLKGRTWMRLEAWDVAANGAFTPPSDFIARRFEWAAYLRARKSASRKRVRR